MSPAALAATPPVPPRALLAQVDWLRFACAALLVAQFSEPFFGAWLFSQGITDPPGWVRAIWLPVYGLLVLLALGALGRLGRAASLTPLWVGLALLPLLSVAWSIEPSLTLRRGVALVMTMGLGYVLAVRFDWAGLWRVLASGWAVLVIGSFSIALFAPQIGIMQLDHPGAWAGLWTHKNQLGAIMALGAVVSLGAALYSPGQRLRWAALGAGCALLVGLSTSKTAMLTLALGAGLVAALLLAQRSRQLAVLVAGALAAGAVLVGFVLLAAPDVLVSALGRDLTLTGRTDIWQALDQAAAARPWLGYGYRAFWENPLGPAFWVQEAVQWPVTSAHSGWREVGLAFGWVGVGLVGLALVPVSLRAVRASVHAGPATLALPLLVVILVGNISESQVMAANNLFWVVATALAVKLALDAADRTARP